MAVNLLMYFVRFSVLAKGKTDFNIARGNDYYTYREKLFEESRLRFRLKTLEHLVINSINSQITPSSTRAFVFILTSPELPEAVMGQLRDLVASPPSSSASAMTSHLVTVGSGSNADYASVQESVKFLSCRTVKSTGEDVNFCTIRVDDDDALSVNYSGRILRLMSEVSQGYALSFGRGVVSQCAETDRDLVMDHPRIQYYPKTSAGQGFFNKYTKKDGFLVEPGLHIFSGPSHTVTDLKVPTILDSRDISFLRTVSNTNDSAGESELNFYPRYFNLTELREEFPHLMPYLQVETSQKGAGADFEPALSFSRLRRLSPQAKQVALLRKRNAGLKKEIADLKKRLAGIDRK